MASSFSRLFRLTTGIVAALLPRASIAQTTTRVSVDSNGWQVYGSSDTPSISSDGRFVAFASAAYELVPGDTNAKYDVFVRDLMVGLTERVSVDSNGIQANDHSGSIASGTAGVSISADGRYVAFASLAGNLVADDGNGARDVFVHDRLTGSTERVSVSSTGRQAFGQSFGSALSADGRFVAFADDAPNLVSADTNQATDVFLRDRLAGTTERASVNSQGAQGDQSSGLYGGIAISADGRFIAFTSPASNLVSGDQNGLYDVFVRDRATGAIERVSTTSDGTEGNSSSIEAAVSADGRFVAFESLATNLVHADTNGQRDVFVRDR
ncbi:MAG: PD40 domain-containing protein, partial [Planctomycetes bacterium]|nr:PD40 domain-containing protein [Planctomycetota bacterium]